MFWMLPLTIIVFLASRQLAIKVKNPLLNPLTVSIFILVLTLLLTSTPYLTYFENVKWIHSLLPYSVVALAYPLFELMPKIKTQWKSILFITLIASITAMATGVFISLYLGASNEIAASILPKSVTTAIAVSIAESQDGVPSIAALCVIMVGILGAICGHLILNLFKIKSKLARGLAIGAVSHAIGTAKAIEENFDEGAYSSLALVLCGIITSILAPFLFPFIIYLYNSF